MAESPNEISTESSATIEESEAAAMARPNTAGGTNQTAPL